MRAVSCIETGIVDVSAVEFNSIENTRSSLH